MSFLEKKEANHARGMNFPTAGPSWEATRAGPGRVMLQQDAWWVFCPNPCQHRGGQGWPHRPGALGDGHREGRRWQRGTKPPAPSTGPRQPHSSGVPQFPHHALPAPVPAVPCSSRISSCTWLSSASPPPTAAAGLQHRGTVTNTGVPSPKKNPSPSLGTTHPSGLPQKNGVQPNGVCVGGSQGFGGGDVTHRGAPCRSSPGPHF